VLAVGASGLKGQPGPHARRPVYPSAAHGGGCVAEHTPLEPGHSFAVIDTSDPWRIDRRDGGYPASVRAKASKDES
jgi:hypothetical protein